MTDTIVHVDRLTAIIDTALMCGSESLTLKTIGKEGQR